jgi:hypothetical protein
VTKAKVFLKARVRVGRGMPHLKDSLILLMAQYSKDTCVNKRVSDLRKEGDVNFVGENGLHP